MRSALLTPKRSPEAVRKNSYTRSLFRTAEVGAAVVQIAEISLGEFLENQFGYSRAAIAEMTEEMREGTTKKIEMGPADLVEFLREEVIPLLERRVQRVRDADSKARAQALSPPPVKSVLNKKRKSEQRTVFADRTVTSKLGAILVGPPGLVDRALAAVLKVAAVKSYRTIRLFDRPATVSDTGFHNGDLGVSVFAPKWDSILGHSGRLRQDVIAPAERTLSAPTDLVLVDDIGYRPETLSAINALVSFFTRAAKIYKGAEQPAQTSGAGVVAGLKLKPGVQYDGQGLVRIGDLGQRYDLSDVDGKLFGTDNYGYTYPIED